MQDSEHEDNGEDEMLPDPMPPGLVVNDEPTLIESWSQIEHLLRAAHKENALVTNAWLYKSWVRWLHRLAKSSDAGNVLLSEPYWELLQQGFRPASAEQRRYCLYILGRSINLLDHSVNVSCFAFAAGDVVFKEAYEKYCTLFSTFVLDRYINQVEECLPDLRDLAAPSGQVDPSWVIVLLGAVLHHGIQDSVRKAVGEHFMQWSLSGFTETAVWPDFLRQSFLPWACQGYLFTSSITKSASGTRCEHGERLASLIDRLVRLCVDENEVLSFVRLLLQYIVDTPRLFPYAGCYILQGLLRGYREFAQDVDVRFTGLELDLARRIAARADLPEMARDAWKIICQDLCQINGTDDGFVRIPTSEQALSKEELEQFDVIQSTSFTRNPTATGTDACSSMQELLAFDAPARLSVFLELVERTKYRCLQRENLLRAVYYVERCLTAVDPSDKDLVHSSLLAIWTEIEIQDYPKAALTHLPRVIFTEEVFFVCTDRPEVCDDEGPGASLGTCSEYPSTSSLHDLLLDTWRGLLRLCKGRIYVLAPLTRVLHILGLTPYGEAGIVQREVSGADGDKHMHEIYPPFRLLPFYEFIVDIATNPPKAKVEFELEAAIAPLLSETMTPSEVYQSHYGEPQSVAYAYLFDLLNRVKFSSTSLKLLLNRLLQPWIEQQQPVLIVSKWKHTIQLQLMLLLVQQVGEPILLGDYFRLFLKVLAIETMPRYRFLLQWIILAIYAKVENEHLSSRSEGRLLEDMTAKLLEPLGKVEQDNPKFLGSLLKICVAMCKIKIRASSSFPTRLMTAMVAMCASPKIVVRHEAQWSFVALWEYAKQQEGMCDTHQREQWTSIVENPVLAALSEYMQSLDRYTNPPPERLLEEFNFDNDNTLCNLFEGDYLRTDPPEAPIVTRDDFIHVWSTDGPRSLGPENGLTYGIDDKGLMTLGKPREPKGPTGGKDRHKHRVEKLDTASNKAKAPLQTKASSWQTVLDTLSDSSLNPSINRHVRPIIVFASHIASAVNLGGLSRASEVFGAQALVVAKGDIINDKAFLGVSVNSHLHLPIEEIKPDEPTVLAWLTAKRTSGYGIVGVEQTDRSIVLGKKDKEEKDTKAFPENCVLIMGSEKEGIPGWLLAECDAGCVEIPQVGVTRSLNVQTAAAVALYEYGRQWG